MRSQWSLDILGMFRRHFLQRAVPRCVVYLERRGGGKVRKFHSILILIEFHADSFVLVERGQIY